MQSNRERSEFCGHTDVALNAERDGVSYFNSGSWIDTQCTYITIDLKERKSMSTQMELTIVIPAKNESLLLPLLLDSLVKQDYPGMRHTKVFVADAGSTDGTQDIALSYDPLLDIEVIPADCPPWGERRCAISKVEIRPLH